MTATSAHFFAAAGGDHAAECSSSLTPSSTLCASADTQPETTRDASGNFCEGQTLGHLTGEAELSTALTLQGKENSAEALFQTLAPAGTCNETDRRQSASLTAKSLATGRKAGSFTVLLLNVQSLNSAQKLAELTCYLEQHQPTLLALNETWLDPSTPNLVVPNYELVARRDRAGWRPGTLNHGGVALYKLAGSLTVTHLEDSETAERQWFSVHTDLGPALLGVWYRPPDAQTQQTETLDGELEKLSSGHFATYLVGDLNVWHKKWLRFSPKNTSEGELLMHICSKYGLVETVRQPTRGDNLLDLVLTNAPQDTATKVTPKLADHQGVLATVIVPCPTEYTASREVWCYKKASWKALRAELKTTCWNEVLQGGAHSAAKNLTEYLLTAAKRHVPKRFLEERKSSHPWVNDKCKHALEAKQAAEGTPGYKDAAERCSATFTTEYAAYTKNLRQELLDLPKGSKLWWRKNRELLHSTPGKTTLPSLKDPAGHWVHDPLEKANLFSKTFAEKCTLPEDSDFPVPESCGERMGDFTVVRRRWALRVLRNLRTDSATGPDELPARVLKECADQLATPVVLLVRMLLREGCWPECWKLHWVVPLHKRKAVYKAENYRGVHLTTVLSKVAERVVNTLLSKYLQHSGAFGSSQFAFQQGLSCGDLVATLVCTWLLAMENREKVGVYLSDISGAFDRVETGRLLAKLRAAGVNDVMLRFLASYLSPRKAVVLVNGKHSRETTLENMVFQGTVLGPSLWNAFFRDVQEAAECTGGRETKFADDLSVSKTFPASVPNEEVLSDLKLCQERVHKWGALNRVSFDAGKEEFAVVHHQHGEGRDFRLLGPVFDAKLLMHSAVQKLVSKAKPKTQALLKLRRFYSTSDLVYQFKTHVLCVLEGCTAAVYHAATSVLRPLDRVLDSFLEELGLSREEAFLRHNLAPLTFRRDVDAGAAPQVHTWPCPPEAARAFSTSTAQTRTQVQHEGFRSTTQPTTAGALQGALPGNHEEVGVRAGESVQLPLSRHGGP